MKKHAIWFVWLVAMLLVVSTMLAGCGGGGGGGGGSSAPTNSPAAVELVAGFTPNVIIGTAPLTVTLTDNSTGATAAEWTVDGVVFSTTQGTQTHMLATPGVYSVGQRVTNAKGLTVSATPVNITVTAAPVAIAPIKANGFKAIPNTIKIVWASNKSFALQHPEWEDNAKKVIADWNAALSNSPFINSEGVREFAGVQFVVERFMTYPDDELESAGKNPAYYFDNGFNAGYGGGTIFTYVYKDYAQIPLVSMRGGLRSGGAGSIIINGKRYGQAFAAEPDMMNTLVGEAVVTQNTGAVGNFQRLEYLYIHEGSHAFLGLAAAEGYNYVWVDKSGIKPTLSYNQQDDSKDPMDMVAWGFCDLPAPTYLYSEWNSFLIQKNRGQYGLWEITQAVPAQIWIKVVDAQGYVVSGARITLYGAAKNQIVEDGSNQANMIPVLGTFITDSYGYTKINTSDVWDTYSKNLYIAWGFKVESGGKYAGEILTVDRLERRWVKESKDVYEMNLILQAPM